MDICKSEYSEIILTTDQDLINDGVQAIDDEFLEWFVKNPSCEEVEVNLIKDSEDHPEIEGGYREEWQYYEIIIPKEEPKQRLEKYSERFDNKENEIVQGIFNPENWGNRLVNDEPKQETAAEWLVSELKKYDSAGLKDQSNYVIKMPTHILTELEEQAKEMEKQQQDKFSIDFFNWCTSQEAEDLMHDLVLVGEVDKNTTTKQLLEIYKNK